MSTASFNRLRPAYRHPFWPTLVVMASILVCFSDTGSVSRTESPVYYFTWSGFPVLSFREADNSVSVTESSTRRSSKPYHFPIPFTFNGKPAYAVHVTQATKPPKHSLTSSFDDTTPPTTPIPSTESTLSPPGVLSKFKDKPVVHLDSASTFTNTTHEVRESVLQSRISPNVLKLHNTFVGNGRPHSFFILKSPGGRIYDLDRKSSRRRNRPRTNVKKSS